MANVDFPDIANKFVQHYYTTFDDNRQNLASLYRDNSMLTFEGAQQLGTGNIVEKLVSLPFQKVKHVYSAVDAQPTASGGIIILVAGQLVVDDGQNPLPYTQTFHLCPDPAGQWFVFNDIFRLVLG